MAAFGSLHVVQLLSLLLWRIAAAQRHHDHDRPNVPLQTDRDVIDVTLSR